MAYPKEQIEELKGYCKKVGALLELGIEFFHLEALALPDGCTPATCNALLCPVNKDGYPSRLYFSEQISSRFTRNWNGTVRIAEKNWYAFSWRVDIASPTLVELLLAHLNGFAKEK